jgi:hypothetical protein
MKKMLALIPILLVATLALAAGPSKTSGKSDMAQLYLYAKDPVTWNIIPDGAWGKMSYSSNSFVFNGHGLTSGTDYSLIYYPDINVLTLNFECTSGCSGTYTHTMIIDTFDKSTGVFTGHGYYNADNSYTWTVTGTSKDTFTLVYMGSNAGYTVTCVSGACTGPGQAFTLGVVDTGSAVWSHPIDILGTGTANGGGNVNIAGDFNFKSLPWTIDLNSGSKIWLVKSSDIVPGKLSGWNPTEYLFEYKLI